MAKKNGKKEVKAAGTITDLAKEALDTLESTLAKEQLADPQEKDELDMDALADAAALAAALGTTEAKMEPVVEIAKEHADQCDPELFGTYSATSGGCRDCEADFPECAAACKALQAFNLAKNKPVKQAKIAVNGDGTVKVHRSREESKTADVRNMLLFGIDSVTYAEWAARVGYRVSLRTNYKHYVNKLGYVGKEDKAFNRYRIWTPGTDPETCTVV